jgi:hypothetical protein
MQGVVLTSGDDQVTTIKQVIESSYFKEKLRD